MASQPAWTETIRTKEISARSRARGISYGFSESRSGTSKEAATEAEGDISDAGRSICMPDTTSRQRRCASVVNWLAPARTTRETPGRGKAYNRPVSRLLDSGKETERLCPPLSAPHSQESTSALLKNLTNKGCIFFTR